MESEFKKLKALLEMTSDLDNGDVGYHHQSMKLIRKMQRQFRFGRVRTSTAVASLPRVPTDIPFTDSLSLDDYEYRFGMKEVTMQRVFGQVVRYFEDELTGMGLRTHFSLHPWNLFCICVEYLHRNEPYKGLGKRYGLSAGSVSKVLLHWLPVLRSCMTSTNGWFTREMYENAPYSEILQSYLLGAVDGSYMKRRKVHPRQDLWYRGDKKCHGMHAQLICTASGEIVNVQLWKGHNNDMGVFGRGTIPNIPAFGDREAEGEVEEGECSILDWARNISAGGYGLLADGGYNLRTAGILSPTVCPFKKQTHPEEAMLWNAELARFRVVVEQVFARVKCWMFAQSPRTDVHFQAMGLMVIFWLVNEDLKDRPLRKRN